MKKSNRVRGGGAATGGERGRWRGGGGGRGARGKAAAQRSAAARAHRRERPRTSYVIEADGTARLGSTFSVMSYNVLAQSNVEKMKYMYRGRPEYMLKWEHRSEMLLAEISAIAPTVLCMQECDAAAFPFFARGLGSRGYASRFCKRGGRKVDGCAVFWSASEFELGGSSVRFFPSVG